MPIPRNSEAENGGNFEHHCGECNRAPSARCFKQIHIAYCEACKCIFTVKSSKCGGGCIGHPYSEGYNLKYKKIKSDLPEDHRTELETRLEVDAQERMKAEAERREQVAAANEASKPQPRNGKVRRLERRMQKAKRFS